MKTDSSANARAGAKPFQSVRTPTTLKYGAAVAIVLFFAFIAFYYFGPKGEDRWGAASRPVGGDKVEAPLAPASASAGRAGVQQQ